MTESDLERAERRLLECCHDAIGYDAEDFDFYELRRLAEEWQVAKLRAMSEKIS